MSNPMISVVLPAYNAEKYLAQAIESILKQSYSDFELIIINDGSTDNTETVISSYVDSRILYVKNESNLGLIGTLNKGFELAKGKYIARMDADDISYIDRFKTQVEFLENHDDYVICSSARTLFNDSNNKTHLSIMPVEDVSIRVSSIFSTPFTHPSVMIRRSVVSQYFLKFEELYKYAEDYAFWMKILQYGKGYNFKVPLVYYRDTPNSQTNIGVEKKIERERVISAIQQIALKNIGISISERDRNFLYLLSLSDYIRKINFDDHSPEFIKKFFYNISVLLLRKYPTASKHINRVLGKRYLKIIVFNLTKLSFYEFYVLVKSKFLIGGLLNLIREKYV